MTKLLTAFNFILLCLIFLTVTGTNENINKHNLELKKEVTKLKKQLALSKIINQNDLVEPAILKAIIHIESSNNPKAYNRHTGAIGLMQLTPIVYNDICSLTKREAFNPIKNVACGSLYFSHLLNRFNGNIEKSLSYYNNGYRGNRRYVMKVKNKIAEGVN